MLSVLWALVSAWCWGAADFCGGLAGRRLPVALVLVSTQCGGALILLGVALVSGEAFPARSVVLWASLAGLGISGGLVLLYRALADGQMSLAAPLSALLGASLPALVSWHASGWPSPLKLSGFLLAAIALWLLARPSGRGGLSRRVLAYALTAGVFFALFFVALERASQEHTWWPLVCVRLSATLVVAPWALAALRQVLLSPRAAGQSLAWHSLALIAAGMLCDIAANVAFVLSAQRGDLALAALVASLYPGSTVLLSCWCLRERLAPAQLLGVGLALGAIVLIGLGAEQPGLQAESATAVDAPTR